MTTRKATCKEHPGTVLVCMKCMGAKGGKRTAVKHPEKVGVWAAKGRRANQKRLKQQKQIGS